MGDLKLFTSRTTIFFERAGWKVVPFSMHNAQNSSSEWSSHFVRETTGDLSSSPVAKISRALNAIYSTEAARHVRRLVALTRPDIAHAHNVYHHLTPSVLVELHRREIPIVLTLHDLKLVCPADKMHTKGAVCEDAAEEPLRNVIKNRCIKNSAAMSALVWLESTIHKALGLYMSTVTRFVVPSRFFPAKFAEWGVDTSRFVHIPNSIDAKSMPVEGDPGDAFVYVGRLAPEKGVATLIRAGSKARVRLRIVGTGPEETALRQLACELGGDVEFTGYLSGSALDTAISSARAVVIPSEWYENAPLSVMEASALGRPVIGANIGGIPELIRTEETGGRRPYCPTGTPGKWRGISLRWLPSSKIEGFEALAHTFLGVQYASVRRPDVLHIHAVGPWLLVPLAKLLGLKIVVTHHGQDYLREKWKEPARAILRLGERLGMTFADERIVISSSLLHLARAKYGRDATLIPNGVSEIKTPETRVLLDKHGLEPLRYVIQVSRLVPEKRQLDLLTAFKAAAVPGWKLLLVGGAQGSQRYAEMVRNRIAGDESIVSTGFLSPPEVQQLLVHAEIFALPSSHEGLPIPLLEAMKLGTPVLASNIPANLEMRLEEACYFPVGDTAALARRLGEFATFSAEQRALIGQRLIESCARYDWDVIAESTMHVLEPRSGAGRRSLGSVRRRHACGRNTWRSAIRTPSIALCATQAVHD